LPELPGEYGVPDKQQYLCPTCNVVLLPVQGGQALSGRPASVASGAFGSERLKGPFKALFKKNKVVTITSITGTLGLDPATPMPRLL
jgi:hypothetical protein